MAEIVDLISWIVQKTCLSLYIFLEFILLRLLDLLGLVFNIIACLTIIRLPPMILQLANLEGLAEWRYIGIVHCLIFISDIPVMIGSVILLVTVYRVFPVCQELKDNDCQWDTSVQGHDIYYSGWKPRKIILKHFALLFIDAMFIPAGLLCLCSWRCVIFLRALQQTEDPWERRKTCFKQLLNIFVDIPCLVLYLICCCTWRLPFIINSLNEYHANEREDWKWDNIRFFSFYHFGLLLLDIPCLVIFFFLMFTWRSPFLIHKVSQIHIFQEDGEMKARRLALVQFFLLLVDIPCILSFLIVAVTLWRLPFFIQDCKAAFKKNKSCQWIIRRATISQVGLLFADIACFILGLLILVTVWRIYPLVQSVRKILKPKEDNDQTQSKDEPTEVEIAKINALSEPPDISGRSEGDQSVGDQSVGDQGRENGEENTSNVDIHTANVDIHTAQIQQEELNQGENASLDKDDRIISSDMDFKERIKEIDGVKSAIGWKIRKAICIQFVSLLIDIPAFALLLVLVVTIVRLPKLLSTFLQSGDIYLEFAMTIYFETVILLVDVLFLLLFLFLMILRPFESWIRLLEDEDHMKYRLLCHYMQWIPDIAAKRESVYQRIHELLSVDLKMYCSPSNHRLSVDEIMDEYIDELMSIRQKVNTNELDPEYQYLLDTVIWWEQKRSNKILRHYTCEYNYLLRPDVHLHKENLAKLKREMQEFEAKVNEQYICLKQFTPVKVPLWTVSTGLSMRTRKETQKVLIHCLPRGNIFVMILAFLCCLTLYRAPRLITNLWRQWYNRANIVLYTVREIGYDLLTLLRILIVMIFLYRAPALLSDISIDIVDKRSWKAVRETVRKYPMYIMEDFVNVFKTLLSWKTPRFLFTAMLFGILMPADIFLTASKLCIKNVRVAYLLTFILYLVFVGFPFIMPFYLGKKLLDVGIGWVSVPLLCVFSGVLLVILAMMVAAYLRSIERTTLIPKPFDYFHWNWFNAHVMLMEVLEFIQLLALAFTYSDIPIYGGSLLNDASKFLLSSNFSFIHSFWLSFILFLVWFFLSSVPIIFEQILEDLPKGTCEKHSGWRMAISLFANTLFITLVEGFASCLACSYVKCPSGVDYSTLPLNSTCLQSSLKDDSKYSCWEGYHSSIGFFGLFALVWYTTTSLLLTIQYGDPGIKKQDVEFSPTYNVISNIIKSVMIIGVVVITTNKYAMLALLIIGNAIMISYTMFFKVIFQYRPTNSLSFMAWRLASYSAALIAAVAVIVAYKMDKPGNKIPFFIFLAGVLLSLIIAFILSIVFRQKGKIVEARDNFKRRLLSLEKRLEKDNLLLSSWKRQQSAWKYMVRRVCESRRDDQIFNEANWAQLKEKKQEEVVSDDSATLHKAERDYTEELSSGPAVVDEASKDQTEGTSPQDQMLDQDLPPPPSYGSIPVDDHNESALSNVQIHIISKHKEIIEVSPFDQPLLSLERNGVNLLLVLEKSILFHAYSYSFFSQRSMWLSSVDLSNWTGLLHCLDVLESNLDFSFGQPSSLDISLGKPSLSSDALDKDPRDDDEPPSFTPESRDPLVIEANSQRQRDQALSDVLRIENHGEHWKVLLDKFLPNLPVIKSWNYDESCGSFEILLRRSVTATIKGVGQNGIKLAKGATISLGKVTKGKLSSNKMMFSSDFQPKASKGPISVTVIDITFRWKKNMWYLESQGRTVKYDVAVDSMQVLKWC